MQKKIERIILKHDKRGISALTAHLPKDFCMRATEHILNHRGTALITTGFYIPGSDAPETDGPPGALALGSALHRIGYTVLYVVAMPLYTIMRDWIQQVKEPATIVDYCFSSEVCFPATRNNKQLAQNLLNIYNPDILISIERCSPNDLGAYPNMHGIDTANHTASIDQLFTFNKPSVGIGDGGNEIGMGNLAETIRRIPHLPNHPAIVSTDELIIGSTSNWGTYGLIAALSIRNNRNLLPSIEEDMTRIQYLVSQGVVDGVIGKPVPCVDGFTLEENAAILQQLHDLVNNTIQQEHQNTHQTDSVPDTADVPSS